MPSSSTITAGILLALVGIIIGSIFIFGLPAQLKRDLQEKALETLGESEATYALNSMIGRMPEDNRLHAGERKSGLGKLKDDGLQSTLKVGGLASSIMADI